MIVMMMIIMMVMIMIMMMMMQVSKASRSSRGTSYKDMGQKRSHNGGGSSSYKNMNSQPAKSAVPSRLTVSRLEQVRIDQSVAFILISYQSEALYLLLHRPIRGAYSHH